MRRNDDSGIGRSIFDSREGRENGKAPNLYGLRTHHTSNTEHQRSYASR